MDNFFEKKEKSSNPFANNTTDFAQKEEAKPQKTVHKRLNIMDMDALTNGSINSEIEYIKSKMSKLQQIINKKPQTLDPISLEKTKIEWEDLRLQLYKLENTNKSSKTTNTTNSIKGYNVISKAILSMNIFSRLYSPKIRQILASFKEINKEVEELVKKSTPVGEEDLKYGLLVNKLYQATKLNGELTYKIK